MTAGAPECPVFYPTLHDVTSSTFAEYIERMERTSKAFREAGVCRIVAPDGWTPHKGSYSRLNFDLPRPIRQHATGRAGLYRTLMVESRSMPLSDFRDMAREAVNAAPRGEAGKEPEPEELERQFWRNVTLNPPLYGADVPGSLFDPSCKGWTLRRLRSLLSDTLEAHSIRMPGVNEPYLYIGSWRSVFAWHTEDMDLHSVNYLHCGAAKQWYVIPPAYRARFERLMASLLQDLFRACPEFMRHKELLVSPQLLASHSIPVVRAVHRPREFVVVGPGAYHSGFNHGFNVAESVNFATKAWLPVGANAGYCECTSDSARIDMRLFSEHMPPKLRREVQEMYASSSDEEEESDDDDEGSEEQSGSEEEEEAEAASSADEAAPQQQRRRRQREPAAARKRARPPAQQQRGAAADSSDEEEEQQPVKRGRMGMVVVPNGAAANGTNGVAANGRPQRTRRAPRRDLDMLPIRVRPAPGASEPAFRAQQQQQQQAARDGRSSPALAAGSRKRARARGPKPSKPMLAKTVVGTSSRGRPLLARVLDLLPFGSYK